MRGLSRFISNLTELDISTDRVVEASRDHRDYTPPPPPRDLTNTCDSERKPLDTLIHSFAEVLDESTSDPSGAGVDSGSFDC